MHPFRASQTCNQWKKCTQIVSSYFLSLIKGDTRRAWRRNCTLPTTWCKLRIMDPVRHFRFTQGVFVIFVEFLFYDSRTKVNVSTVYVYSRF